MSPVSWFALLGICLLAAATPGASLAVVLHHALRGGRGAGLTAAWAHASGIALYAVATAVGLSAWLRQYPGSARLLTAVGALYLAWLGIRALLAARQPRSGASQPARATAAGRDGFVIALCNPKVGGFFLALFTQFVTPDAGWQQTLVLVVTPVAVDGLWYSLVALLAGSRRWQAWLTAHAALVDTVTGMSLLVFAGVAAMRALAAS